MTFQTDVYNSSYSCLGMLRFDENMAKEPTEKASKVALQLVIHPKAMKHKKCFLVVLCSNLRDPRAILNGEVVMPIVWRPIKGYQNLNILDFHTLMLEHKGEKGERQYRALGYENTLASKLLANSIDNFLRTCLEVQCYFSAEASWTFSFRC